MIEHPFLDFKKLTDDELLNKAIEIQKKLLKAQMWGSGQDIIGQLSWMMDMIDEEKGERLFRERHEQFNSMFPEVIESDPDFVKEKVEAKDSNKPEKPVPHKRLSAFPTSFDKEYVTPDTRVVKKPPASE